MRTRVAILIVLALALVATAQAGARNTTMFNTQGGTLGWVAAGQYPNSPNTLQIYWHDNYDAGTVDTNPRGTFLVVQDHHGHALGLARRVQPGKWAIYKSRIWYESGPNRYLIGRAVLRGQNRWDVYEGQKLVGYTQGGRYGPQAAAAMLLVEND